MGKLILCTGERAGHPYKFQCSDIRLYTIEELCYFIYQNIEIVSGELFQEELVLFIRDELKMPERAEFIDSLRKKNAGLKDMVVSILCSSDYYTEKEIKDLIAEIDMLYRLNPIQRQKRSADLLMAAGEYAEAVRIYHKILNSKELNSLTPEECGDVMHNAAVADAVFGSFAAAAEGFREAYERSHRKESLKQYLAALKLSKQDALYEKELNHYIRVRSLIGEIGEEYAALQESFRHTKDYASFQEILRLKDEGRVEEFNAKVDEVLDEFKSDYRKVKFQLSKVN